MPGPLRLGYILPETGSLVSYGPPTIGGFNLAAQDVNAAGGVLGVPIQTFGGDEGNAADPTAIESADRLISTGHVNAIVSTAGSSTLLTMLSKITGAGVVNCSPATTSPVFNTAKDNGYLFRAQASDDLQGPVLAKVITGDGNKRVAILARHDSYAQPLAAQATAALTKHGAQVVTQQFYDPTSTNFAAVVGNVVAARPDAVFVIAFAESAALLRSMIEHGIGPANVHIYAGSGSRISDLATSVVASNPGILNGMKGVSPSAPTNSAFVARLKAVEPNLTITQFSSTTYDCVVLLALAAERAHSVASADIKANMLAVSRPGQGQVCTTYASCKALVDQGKQIDYHGVSGFTGFTSNRQPATASYDTWEFTSTGTIVTVGRNSAP